ncbi:stage II sporulation protein P [Thermincola ferriacetica]
MNNWKNLRLIWGIVLLGLGLSIISYATAMTLIDTHGPIVAYTVAEKLGIGQIWEKELKVGEYITIVDERTNEVLDKISRQVYRGDKIITEDNREYEVINVKGNRAMARKLGMAKGVVWKPEWDEYATLPVARGEMATQGNGKAQIGIYYTHSDESYVPTDGSESIPGRGGVMKVGTALAEELRKKGVSVVNDKTSHEPHDSTAYHRSRRTAVELLKKRPIALIDVHRDGVPDPDFYNDKIDGEDVTKLRLVVGRQNPNMATNLEFAKKVKAYVDRAKPGLIKEIFIGHGNYNQDLGPKAMLIEVGTHTNSRFFAENGAALFAEALPRVLNLQTAQKAPGGITNPLSDTRPESRSAWTTLAWILGIVLVGAAAFLFISTGSVKGVKSKLGEITKTEFANYLGDGKTEEAANQDGTKDLKDKQKR